MSGTHYHDDERRTPSITSILAVIATVWILGIFTAVLFFKPVCGDGTVNLIIQAVYGILMLVMGFYFGTSYGSMVKTDLMAKMEPRPLATPSTPRKCCRPDHPHEGGSSGGAVG